MCLNETYSKVRIGKHLSDSFPIQNSPNKEILCHHCFSTLQENQVGLKLNGTNQFLADVVNLLGDNIDTIKKDIQSLIDASKEVCLEINVEETKYMLLTRHQNAGQNRDIKIANRSFENVPQFKYLWMTVINKNLNQEEIKRRLNSGNACYHYVQNLLSPRLLSKNLKLEYTRL
jgi:phage tail sheath gpL-like